MEKFNDKDTQPITRIDDYPTGVKPIINNRFIKFSKVLSLFEERGLKYLLGVVPALINEEDISFIKSLEFCEVALHGFDHNFHTFSEGNREEFKGWAKEDIREKLKEGLNILKDFQIRCYVPPFNIFNQELVDAVNDLAITSITSGCDKPELDFHNLDVITPKRMFYSKSTQILGCMEFFNANTDHLSLHLTWEIEELNRLKEHWALPKVLDILLEKTK